MANFLPLKAYMLFCLDRFVERYPLQGRFLEVAAARAYTRLKSPPPSPPADRDAATKASAGVNAWDVPGLSRWLDRTAPLWAPVHRVTFRLFRGATGRGHEFFALARKPVVP